MNGYYDTECEKYFTPPKQTKHKLIKPTDPHPKWHKEGHCPICDGGLGICSVCGKAGAELYFPCIPQIPLKLREEIRNEIHLHYPMASEASKDYTTAKIILLIDARVKANMKKLLKISSDFISPAAYNRIKQALPEEEITQ